MEKDGEISNGNYTTHFRALDTRIGRWLSDDPVTRPELSPYNSMDNNPILLTDPNGDCAICRQLLRGGATSARGFGREATKLVRAADVLAGNIRMKTLITTVRVGTFVGDLVSDGWTAINEIGVTRTTVITLGTITVTHGSIERYREKHGIEGIATAPPTGTTTPTSVQSPLHTPTGPTGMEATHDANGSAIMRLEKFNLDEDEDGIISGEFGFGEGLPEIEFMGQVKRKGNEMDITDFAVYPKGEKGENSQAGNYGVRGVLQGLGALKKWAKAQGMKVLNIKGTRHEESSSATPGMEIDKKFDLDK